jgi:glycogen debranching enzyme
MKYAPDFRLVFVALLTATGSNAMAQAGSTLADLRWDTTEASPGRYVVVPGRRAFVSGYNATGLEVWTAPLQLVRGYRITFRADGDTGVIDGRSSLRRIEQTPMATTRVYEARGITVRERIFTPVDIPAATITYTVQSTRPIVLTVHFTPSLNLMWPGAVGGQELHWDAAHSAYLLDEPSHRFRGVISSPQIVAHDEWQNSPRAGDFARDFTFTLRPDATGEMRVVFAGASSTSEDAVAIAQSVAAHAEELEAAARERYSTLQLLDIVTPDSAVNRALHSAQVTLEQAWACNPQLGCGSLAGYGPSRGERRPQYAWFFAGDGLVATDALLREGAYARAREELEFILRYQNKRTGAIWHELSQSAGFLDWENAYPYMFVHVDVSFDFLNSVRDYVQTTGDVAFATAHWDALRRVYDYCRATVPPGKILPEIPAGQQGRDEQDPQRDELSLSLAWVTASESFATLAELTNHADLAREARSASQRARAAIRPNYFDAGRGKWVSGHLRSGAPVEGVTGGLIALLHLRLLDDSSQRVLLDDLSLPAYRAGWGIRSTPTTSPLYDPDSYARGSVWAVSTADAVTAFYEGGRPDVATSLWLSLIPWFGLDAPGHMHEVLRGDVFAAERESVPDQTWSSAAFLSSAVSGLLGITVNTITHELHFAPRAPIDWRTLEVRHLKFAGSDVSLKMRTSPETLELVIENTGQAMTFAFAPPLARTHIQSVDVSAGARLVSDAENAGRYELRVSCPAHAITTITLRLTPLP